MKVARTRANVLTITGTAQEISALVAAGRLALEAMQADPRAPREVIELLTRVLRDYDRAVARLKMPDGRPGRPSADSPSRSK